MSIFRRWGGVVAGALIACAPGDDVIEGASESELHEAPAIVDTPSFDPLSNCDNLAQDVRAFEIVGPGVAGATADDAHPVRLSSTGRATFLTTRSVYEGRTRPTAPYQDDVLLTARFGASASEDVVLLTGATAAGHAFGLRVGESGPELVRHGPSDDAVLARSTDASSPRAKSNEGEWILRLSARRLRDGVSLAGKAWLASGSEPPAWQVAWSGTTSGIQRSEVRAGVALTARNDVALAYVIAGHVTGDGIEDKQISKLVSCRQDLPRLRPPRDGETDIKGEAANQAEARDLLRWALRSDARRLVVMSAGTGNNLDPAGAVVACEGAPWMNAAREATTGPRRAQCITGGYQAMEIAYASLRSAGYSDEDLRDASRVQLVLWGFGESTRDALLWYHPTGSSEEVAMPILGLGGATAALHGPDGAPPTGFVPFASTFAYTHQHARKDARNFRDAIVELARAATFPGIDGRLVELAADHVLLTSHSWGAAYTTTMLLREYPQAMPGVHVDLGITAALPKITVDLDQLGPCAVNLLTGNFNACMAGAGAVVPRLDVEPGFYVGPGGVGLYRIDRPDDPVAIAHDPGSLFQAAQYLLRFGMSGHDHVVRASATPAAATCTRAMKSCALGPLLCRDETEAVRHPEDARTQYVGIYGIDTFHLSCATGGGVLEYRCTDIQQVAGTVCKTPPGGGTRVCTSKPNDCP